MDIDIDIHIDIDIDIDMDIDIWVHPYPDPPAFLHISKFAALGSNETSSRSISVVSSDLLFCLSLSFLLFS